MKIPFSLTMSGLILKGKNRERARIEYEMTGQEKERNLLALDYDTVELQKLPEYKVKKLNIDKKYGLVDDFQYDLEMTSINYESKSKEEKDLAELEIYLKYKKISGIDYCKKKNDILGKPWVAIKTNYDENVDPDNMEIEVVYNKKFIESMRAKGLPGETDEDIAEQWLKLFFIANLEEEDLSMINDEYSSTEDKQYLRKTKIDNSTTFIS